jgi:hypothetical protein
MGKTSSTGWPIKVKALIETLGAVVELLAKVVKLWREFRP